MGIGTARLKAELQALGRAHQSDFLTAAHGLAVPDSPHSTTYTFTLSKCMPGVQE